MDFLQNGGVSARHLSLDIAGVVLDFHVIDTVVGNQKSRVRFGGNLCQINAESVNFLVVFLPFGSLAESPAVYSTSWRRISQPSAFCATISSGSRVTADHDHLIRRCK